MYVIKNMRCHRCNGEKIEVIPYEDEHGVVVSHGVCQCCLGNIILPQEDYRSFIKEYCIRSIR